MRHSLSHAGGILLLGLVGAGAAASAGGAQDSMPAPARDPGASMTLGATPPRSGPVQVLFDGSSFSGWTGRAGKPSPWALMRDGSVRAGGGDALTREAFGDFQLHLEFLCPSMPGERGQARSNSGVYVHGRYEVQVLDTFGQKPAGNGCGAVYSIAPPLVNAARPADTWQTYDIIFRAPRFGEDDRVVERPRITVLHNGVVVHNNLELPGTTPGGLDDVMVRRGPLLLQDHGDPVRYRNIWVRPL